MIRFGCAASLFIVVFLTSIEARAKQPADVESGIAAITKLGGKVFYQDNDPNKNVIKVSLRRIRLTNDDLVHLAPLTTTQEIILNGFKYEIDDAGLKHLAGLKDLKKLWLLNTQIKGPGLKHLVELKKLRTLWLSDTDLTDAGLRHIGKMPNLRALRIDRTEVTDVGLAHLKT